MTDGDQIMALARFAGIRCPSCFAHVLHDLNAVAKLEAKLDEDTYNPGYIETLRKVIMDQEEIRGQGSDVLPNRIISATARQRCEALLRVLKLWKE